MEWYTSYQSLIVARESANWAFGSMLVAIVSALISLITLIVACKAMSSWKQQEEVNERKNLIKAYLNYQHILSTAPEMLTPKKPDQWQVRYVNLLHDAIIEIRACIIVMMDDKSHEKYGKGYLKLLKTHQAYLDGEMKKEILSSVLRSSINTDLFKD